MIQRKKQKLLHFSKAGTLKNAELSTRILPRKEEFAQL